METRLTAVGLLIWAAMGGHLAAFVALVRRDRRAGLGMFAGGFALATAALVVRGIQVGHAPMQNMFEVFLVMGAMVFPISLLSRRALGVGGEAADALVGFLVLFAPGLVLDPAPRLLLPALQSPLFVPHVAAYMLAYVILAKAAIQAGAGWMKIARRDEGGAGLHERSAYRMVGAGFPLLTLGLVLGAAWGKMAWGDYWNWDPKELWSLATWLVFAGYLHFRAISGGRRARINLALVLVGAACILLTFFWANLGRIFAGLHSYAT